MTTSEPGSVARWVAPAALVIAVIAIGVAIWAVVQSPGEPATKPGEPAANAEQPGDAKAHVCAAFDMVRKSVQLRTNADLGPDPVAKEAVAANARLATIGGGEYLLSRLGSATPPDLATAVRSFANNLQDIGMNQLAGAPADDPAQTTRMADAGQSVTQITDMCK